MRVEGNTLRDYIANCPEDRQAAMEKLRDVIAENLPDGFSEKIGQGFIHYGVPHSIYPPGYHCNPKDPLPFLAIASQKNFIAVYHMGIYSDPELLKWFTEEYGKRVKTKLDMGKSCIRFKKPDQIPFDLIGELCTKMTVDQWIDRYETALKTTTK